MAHVCCTPVGGGGLGEGGGVAVGGRGGGSVAFFVDEFVAVVALVKGMHLVVGLEGEPHAALGDFVAFV
jgi:hypothetical protein